MRTVGAWVVAAVSGLALLTPVAAAPPEDVAAYCRAIHPQVQFQVRCLNVEHAAAERVSRSVAGAVADGDGFNRCLTASPSWAVLESCLAQLPRGAPAPGVGGVVSPTAPDADLGAARPSDAGRPPADNATPAAGSPSAPASFVAAPSPSVIVLGPQPSLAAGPVESERPTRPIPEADADRQLRALLERVGSPTAQCTKKQYGPGWVIICQ